MKKKQEPVNFVGFRKSEIQDLIDVCTSVAFGKKPNIKLVGKGMLMSLRLNHTIRQMK